MEFGVDEAGKGPVLGSMFVAAVRAPRAAIPDAVDDSKRLSDDRRETLAARLHESESVTVAVVELPPARIDDGNMNDLVVAGHAEAATAVARSGDEGLCDAGDVDATRFAGRVTDRLPEAVSVDARHGADGTDDLVAAASVVAKTARERHVDDLAATYGDVGSGYPSDPTTRAFLRDHLEATGEFPACARRSWRTCDRVRAAVEQAGLEEF